MRHGEAENVSGSCREQKKLLWTGSSGWLVCAAVFDCNHCLIVAIGIANAMLASARLANARLTP